MAYIYFNGEKYFPILDFFSSDIMDLALNKSEYFMVDELMAIPVSCLCNKGYLTELCCAGHAIGDLCCETLDDLDVEKYRLNGSLIAVQYVDEYEDEYMCWRGEPVHGAYIVFKCNYELQNIPEGWKYDLRSRRLSCDVSSGKNPMTYYKNISIALELLMDWIMQLPSI